MRRGLFVSCVAVLLCCALSVDAGPTSKRALDLPVSVGKSSSYYDGEPTSDAEEVGNPAPECTGLWGTEVEGDAFVFVCEIYYETGFESLIEEVVHAMEQLSESTQVGCVVDYGWMQSVHCTELADSLEVASWLEDLEHSIMCMAIEPELGCFEDAIELGLQMADRAQCPNMVVVGNVAPVEEDIASLVEAIVDMNDRAVEFECFAETALFYEQLAGGTDGSFTLIPE